MKKYAISLATAVLIGGGMYSTAQANDVLIPYVKAGGNWVSLVSYMTLRPNYNSSFNSTTKRGNLHFIYWYKADWSGFDKISDYLTSKCKEYNDEVPATENDFTTVDISSGNLLGLTNNILGLAEGYDGGSAAPSNSEFTLSPNDVVDAYLVIQDGHRDENTLSAEAVVFDTVTGMFFYQYGIDVHGSANAGDFRSDASIVMFQGEDFATTSVYYIPMANSSRVQDLSEAVINDPNNPACIYPVNIEYVTPEGGIDTNDPARVYDRKEDGKSGLSKVCVTCLGLIPVKTFMSDSAWNKVKNGGGWFGIRDFYSYSGAVPTPPATAGGGVTYKGEVYKIGTKPNIFAPLKSYENSLTLD